MADKRSFCFVTFLCHFFEQNQKRNPSEKPLSFIGKVQVKVKPETLKKKVQCLFNFRIKKGANILKASQKFVYEFRERVQDAPL